MLTLDDLGLLLEELLDVQTKWYNLGLQLNLSVGTQEGIRRGFSDPRDQFLQMLISWLRTSYIHSWKTLIDGFMTSLYNCPHCKILIQSVLHVHLCMVDSKLSLGSLFHGHTN